MNLEQRFRKMPKPFRQGTLPLWLGAVAVVAPGFLLPKPHIHPSRIEVVIDVSESANGHFVYSGNRGKAI